MSDRSSLTEAQREKLIAKRKAARDSMRCVGLRVEVIGRVELFAHAKATTFWRAIKRQHDEFKCAACGAELSGSAASYFAFTRRRPKWDTDTWALVICPECARRADLRDAIRKCLQADLHRRGLVDHYVTQIVLPPELDGVS
jgi:ribosomal protein L34E